MRKKDVVLMATVTSFDSLQHPTKSELRQFAELFAPLFKASTEEAKRQAVAALSQCPQVPAAVALFIGSQPIGISAIFLTCSQAISDETLITIARMQGSAHAKAITRRDNLSPMVIDALVDIHQGSQDRGVTGKSHAEIRAEAVRMPVAPPHSAATTAPVPPAPLPALEAPLSREEAVRQELKKLARHFFPAPADRLGLRTLTEMQDALLVRFARSREADHFATTLADALSASRWLAERIMLDISGAQLATTLVSLGTDAGDAQFVLTRLYPHLAQPDGNTTRAAALLASLDADACTARVEAWRRADRYTYLPNQPEHGHRPEADNSQPPAAEVQPRRDFKVVGRR